MTPREWLALAAAHHCAGAAADLIETAKEWADGRHANFESEIEENLADAIKMMFEARATAYSPEDLALYKVCCAYLGASS